MSSDSTPHNHPADGAVKNGRRRVWVPVLLALLLLVGAGVRVFYALERVQTPDFEHPAVDAGFHDAWARSLAGIEAPSPNLQALEGRPYLRPPGYPLFLAGVYALTGGSRLAAVVTQMTLGLLAGLLAFRVGRRWFGESVGLVAAGLVLADWTLVYFAGELHAPALVIVLLLGSLDLLGRWYTSGGRYAVFAAGLLLGLAALARPNILLVAAVVGIWIACSTGRLRLRAAAVPLLLLMLGVVLAVAPVTIRNARVSGDTVLISSNGGVNLFIGNHERATGLVAGHLPGLGRFETCYDYPRIVERVQRRAGRPLSDSEVSTWFAQEALAFARAEPAAVAALTLHKARLFWGLREIPHNKELVLERAHSAVLRNLPGRFPVAALLAAMGLCWVLLERRTEPHTADSPNAAPESALASRGALLLALCIAALFLSVLPFFAAARYRVPVVPLLSLLEAVALVGLARALGARSWGRVGILVACGAAVGALLMGSGSQVGPNESKWHLDRARALRRGGAELGAAAEARLALVSRPQDLEAHFLLGNALAATGDLAGAVEHFRAALEQRPADHRVLNNLGSALAQLGDSAGAVQALEGALLKDPDPAPVHFNLGLVLEGAGDDVRAQEHYRAALELRPGWQKARRALSRVRGLPSGDGQDNLPR